MLAHLNPVAAMRGVLLLTICASTAGAQNQTWIRQIGTSALDIPLGAASDGAGGVFLSGDKRSSLGGAHARSNDAWLAHYDTNPTPYCSPAVSNSTGQPGEINATGSFVIADNSFTLASH